MKLFGIHTLFQDLMENMLFKMQGLPENFWSFGNTR